jgi:hypothetical protein
MLGWLTDAARCIWALLYWNTRKSRYVLAGRRRGRCPCQNQSDIGAAGGVRCEASLHLNKSLRFRHVCPLVVAGPDGRGAYCSVPESQVRPFWGRAVIFFGGSAVMLYLVITTAAFIGMRVIGIESLSWRQVAWPGAWGEIRQERSRYFFQQALIACARRDYQAAYRSMVTAVAQDPNNYDARLFTAQYAAYAGDALLSDWLFDQVLAQFGEQGVRTAITRHDTLLAVGRYDVLALHSLNRAVADRASRPTWVNSLLLAMKLGRLGPSFVAANKEAVAQLGPDAARLVQAMAAIAAGDVDSALVTLRHTFAPGVEPAYVRLQIEMLLKIGAPVDAEMAWTINARNFTAFDRLLARCRIDTGQGYGPLAALEFSSLVNQAAGPADWDKLVATLVMQPDREAFGALHRRAAKDPDSLTFETTALLWVAAVAVGATEERNYWARHNQDAFRVTCPPVEAINFKSIHGDEVGTVPYWQVEPPLAPVRKLPKR